MEQEIPLWLAGVIVAGLIILMALHHIWRSRRNNDKE